MQQYDNNIVNILIMTHNDYFLASSDVNTTPPADLMI